jgi:hypothetical protein
MASAIELNAISTVLGSQGLAANSAVLSAITTFQSKPTVTILANVFASAGGIGPNAAPILYGALDQLGANVSHGKFLLDLYPSNITPVSSGSVTFYGNTNATASVSNTVKTQVNIPFNHGITGFANVCTLAYGQISSSFDHVASTQILKNQTYADSGVGHTGINDLMTHGLSSYGALIADTVSTWGTMYDITKLNLLDDPYVFGQNLLNQGLGKFGNLNVNLTAAGLDIADITHIPSSTTTTSEELSSFTSPSPYGEISLPSLSQTVSTTVVTGGSADVIHNIYKQVKGLDLGTIVSTTKFTSSTVDKLTSLNDFLDFKKVVPSTLLTQWKEAGVDNFTEFGKFVHSKIGNGTFTTWNDVTNLMSKIQAPTLRYTTTKPDTPILSSAAISNINSLGTGTGPLNNPTMLDYLSATAGIGYTEAFTKINSVYGSVAAPVESALGTLKTVVTTWISGYSPGDEFTPEVIPPIGPVTSAVTAVNNTLNNITLSPAVLDTEHAYYVMLNKLTTEVNNLATAQIKFMASDSTMLKSFAQSIVMYSTENDQFYSQQIFANIISNDSYGDTIRAAIAEKVNTEILTSAGIYVNNDPQPANAIYQAKTQNIPLSTYLSLNK